MSATDVAERLGAGRAALAAGDWPAARGAFAAALEQEEVAEALAGLGDAQWWLGDCEAAVRCQARAYALFRRRGEPVQAAVAAIALYFVNRISLGNTPVSRGWLGRLARLVDELGLAPLAGWVLLVRAHDSDDPAAAQRWAREARELAARFADADLELCALSQLGAALVQSGRLEEGAALLDEAMAGALGGEGERPQTVVYTCCNLISACSPVFELARVTQWIRAADEFTRRYGAPHLYTHCRTYYGGVLFATGDWAGAEHELTEALRAGRAAERALYGEALARLAELRLAQGRTEEAQRLIEGFEAHSTSAWVLAALRLAADDPAGALRVAQLRLREIEEHERGRPGPYRAGATRSFEQAALLELLAEARLALGDVVAVDAVAPRLEALAPCEATAARAERVRGRALAARGDAAAAQARLERALAIFGRIGMPFEAARTHLLLAGVLRDAEPAAAVAEAQAALTGLEALGAARDADAAAALLRSLGVKASRGGPNADGVLTRREREVLALLGQGLSNPELADRLFLSRKTVEHHVRSVLSKLGLRNRAEAAAYAVRHLDSAAR